MPRQFSPLLAIRERKCLELIREDETGDKNMSRRYSKELEMYERYRRG